MRLVPIACAVALATSLVYSLLDHPLRMPALAAVFALCAAGLVTLAGERVQAFEIVEDYGGTLAAYREEARRLDASREELAIRGVCASACTIFLGLRRVCVAPRAVFWFHAARLPGAAAPDPLATLEMLSLYPPAVRDWAIRTHALERLDFDEAASLTGEELVRMGARRCRRREAPASRR